jgi:type I restriction enzyme S subunit
MRNALPAKWSTAELGDLVTVCRPRADPREFPDMPFVGMDNVEAHTMRLLGTVPAGTMRSNATHFYPQDVLYGRLRPYLNKVLAPTFEGLASAEFIPLTPSPGVDRDFVRYRLNAADFVSFTSHLDEGDRPRVDWNGIRQFQVSLPPSAEQGRIVEILDSYVTRLDSAGASLKRVQDKLNAYRASVLKAAVEGRLVPTEASLARTEKRAYEPAEALLARIVKERRRRWEEAELTRLRAAGKTPKDDRWRAKYEEQAVPDTSTLPDLPEGWCWASWAQVGFSQNGRAFPSSEYRDTGVRLLRPGNLHGSGRVEWSDKNTRHIPEKWASDYPGYLIGPDELVINLTAQSLADEFLGRVCLTGSGEHCLLNQRIARLTPILLSSRFMLCLFKSAWFRMFVAALNTGSLIQHMFTSQLKAFVFPLPPLAEQERIAAEVERLTTIGEFGNASADHAARRVRALRQAVLEWAFQGRLVDQDPTDEPAETLLARIRAVRASDAHAKKSGGVRAKRSA